MFHIKDIFKKGTETKELTNLKWNSVMLQIIGSDELRQ